MSTHSIRTLTNPERILDREIWPAATRYVRWARTPLGCLALATAVSGLCGAFLHARGFVVMFSLVGVSVLGLIWPRLSLLGLGGTLAFNETRCREGERAKARLALRNRAPWGAWGVAVKTGFGESDEEAESGTSAACLTHVPGGRASLVDVSFVPEVRGEYPLGPPRVTCGFPFGLTEASRPLTVEKPLLVWPRTFPVAPIPEAADGHSSVGTAVRDRAGNHGDLLGVRPYRRGDSIRRVHWGQTARQGELIVCEVQATAVPRARIVLDTDRRSHVGNGPQGSREWCIRIAASLAEGWIGQGAEVEMLLASGLITATGGSARTRAAVFLDALARLKETDGPVLFRRSEPTDSLRGRSSPRVIVTTDLGVERLFAAGGLNASDKFVVLRSQGFGGTARGDASVRPPITPWILIEGPHAAAAALLRKGKGATHASRTT